MCEPNSYAYVFDFIRAAFRLPCGRSGVHASVADISGGTNYIIF